MANFGKYQLIKKLATGGMAEVWLARQTGIEGFNRHVVIKRILPHLAEDPEFVQMFLNEAKIASRFNHPNIAQIYDLGHNEGQYYIAMEFVHGEDLGRLMRKAWSTGQWIARPLAIRIVASACEGLYYAHNRADEEGRPLKVVHRDISPQNILVSFDGSVKVVDFGIAKAADQQSMTKSGAIKGKFAYMAPEQAAGKPLDARTDIFAVGLVLYELLTGVRPLKRESELATLQAALECSIEPPSVVAEVPSELDGVVMRALAKAPDDRYKDARTFQMALEEFLISQRMVATSVQVSELMETLFADRLTEEARLGAPNPSSQESVSGMPGVPEPPSWDAKEAAEPPPEPRARSRDRDRRPPPEPAREPPRERERPPPRQVEDDEPSGHTDPLGTNTEGWEAPAAVPSRKYAQTAAAGRPALPSNDDDRDATRARPTGARPDVVGEARSTRAKSRSSISNPVLRDDRDDVPPEVEEPPRLATPARRSNSGVNLKKKTNGEMPSAPARRSHDDLEEVSKGRPKRKKAADFYDAADGEPSVDVTGIRMRARKSLRGMMAFTFMLALGGLGWFFKDQIAAQLPNLPNKDGVPVLLTISSNPKTRVTVIKASGEKMDLGEVPIDRARGANVGDTVVMSSADLGIYFEDKILFGQPGENRVVVKDFALGKLRVNVSPSGPKNLSLWRGTQHLANNLQLPVAVYEGTQKLELRGEALRQPVAFEVQVKAGEQVVAKVDISAALNK